MIPIYLAIDGDIIFFDWQPNGDPDHIGLVKERISDLKIRTIEGNTSGSKVAYRERSDKEEQATFRPHFKPTSFSADKQLVVDGLFGYSSIAVLQKVLKASGHYTGAIDAILGQGTAKGLQKLLKAKGYYTGAIDGWWGTGTVKATQKLVGVAQDGAWGAKTTKAVQTWLNKEAFGSTQSMTKTVYMGHACADNDKKAGDSSGKEVTKTAFKYSTSSTSPYNWSYVFRPKDGSKAEKAASMCEKAIANNCIGYSKKGETAYGKDKAMTKLAKAVNYDLSKINVKCGLSCGDLICLCNHFAGLSTCYIGSGLQLSNNLKSNSNFETISYKKGMTLKRGDVLITAHADGKNNHVAMVL